MRRNTGNPERTHLKNGKRAAFSLPGKSLILLVECSGPGPSSSAVAPRSGGGATSRNVSVTVSDESSGLITTETTRSTASQESGHISFFWPHSRHEGQYAEFVRMHIRLLHDRGQNHSLVNNRTDDDYQGNTSASQRPFGHAVGSIVIPPHRDDSRTTDKMAQSSPGITATQPRHGRKARRASTNPIIPNTSAAIGETGSRTGRIRPNHLTCP